MNWKSTDVKNRIESVKLQEGNTRDIKDRDARIAELEAEIIKSKEGIRETDFQINKLSNAQQEKERIYAKEMEGVLASNPDASVKKQIDLVYQTNSRDLKQVRSNLEKMHILKGSYALNERKAANELVGIKEEIRVEALDVKVHDLFKKVRLWVKAYNNAQMLFNVLKDTVIGMPQYNQYKDRIDALKLPAAFHVVADSHLRNTEGLSMDKLGTTFSEMTKGSDPYNWPDDLKISYDFTRESDRALVRDSFATDLPNLGLTQTADEQIMDLL